jgi:hypothetical protein
VTREELLERIAQRRRTPLKTEREG